MNKKAKKQTTILLVFAFVLMASLGWVIYDRLLNPAYKNDVTAEEVNKKNRDTELVDLEGGPLTEEEERWENDSITRVDSDDPPEALFEASLIKPYLSHVQSTDGTNQFTFRVVNESKKPKTFTFHSSKEFDYVIKNQKGQTVARYSEGKKFSKKTMEKTLKPGQEFKYTAEIKDLPKGKYTAQFVIPATETVLVKSSFEITK